MTDLRKQAEKLVDDFQSLEIYQQYLKVKDVYFKSKLYKKIQMLEKKKKSAKNIEPSKRKEFLSQIKEEITSLEEDPLYINYQSLRKELLELITPLTETKF